MKKQKFIEPVLIKAGDNRVKLGVSGTPPKVDCRVIAEYGYQQLKKAFDLHNEMLKALIGLTERCDITPNSKNLETDNPFGDALKAIKKATE